MKEELIKVEATGVVWGTCWDGRECGYAATKIQGETEEEVLNELNKAFAEGWLDSGMGFERLNGALMRVTKTYQIEVNGNFYERKEEDFIKLGKMHYTKFRILEDYV